jgi:cbb3-type cytochrome oxidase cytochrome c subunit
VLSTSAIGAPSSPSSPSNASFHFARKVANRDSTPSAVFAHRLLAVPETDEKVSSAESAVEWKAEAMEVEAMA